MKSIISQKSFVALPLLWFILFVIGGYDAYGSVLTKNPFIGSTPSKIEEYRGSSELTGGIYRGKQLCCDQDAGDSLDGAKTAARLCFVAGTMVHVQGAGGEVALKPIELVEVGDLVVSKNHQTGEISYKSVMQLFRNQGKEIINLALTDSDGNEDELGVTAEHPFWVVGKGWVPTEELVLNDQIGSLDGRELYVRSLATSAKLQDTYNFEVAEDHTYFVGELGAWVHNTCKQIFNSIKDAPGYPKNFIYDKGNRLVNTVKNKPLLEQLRQVEPGKWQKIYKNGWSGGEKVSIHYFQSQSGKVFNVKTVPKWSYR